MIRFILVFAAMAIFSVSAAVALPPECEGDPRGGIVMAEAPLSAFARSIDIDAVRAGIIQLRQLQRNGGVIPGALEGEFAVVTFSAEIAEKLTVAPVVEEVIPVEIPCPQIVYFGKADDTFLPPKGQPGPECPAGSGERCKPTEACIKTPTGVGCNPTPEKPPKEVVPPKPPEPPKK